MRHSNDHERHFPDYVRVQVYDTDQTDYAEPMGRGVWTGVFATILLLGLGVGMMALLVMQDGAIVERPRYNDVYR